MINKPLCVPTVNLHTCDTHYLNISRALYPLGYFLMSCWILKMHIYSIGCIIDCNGDSLCFVSASKTTMGADSTSHKMSCKPWSRKVSESAESVFRVFQSLCNLAALLPGHLLNFKLIRAFRPPISQVRDFVRSNIKTSYRILTRGPGDSCLIDDFIDWYSKKNRQWNHWYTHAKGESYVLQRIKLL